MAVMICVVSLFIFIKPVNSSWSFYLKLKPQFVPHSSINDLICYIICLHLLMVPYLPKATFGYLMESGMI